MNNKLLGVLLRFRKGAVAVTADIESMFHCFVVKNEHRRFLRFFWYRDNDFSKGLVEYQMRVHVFGNCPSPAVAAYCLRKAAEVNADIYGDDVMKFVNRNFYVDDGLISLSTPAEATDLIQRTIDSLRTGGNLRLHKIASNSKEVVDSFDASERAKNLKDVDLTIDELPAQQSLGLNWDLRSDTFTYNISTEERPYTRRGLLSSINGIYDPLGMVAPVVVTGKLILREIAKGSCDWDEPLSETLFSTWSSWRDSLNALGDLKVQRTYSSSPLCDSVRKELHLYSDASEQAIAAVAFLKTKYTDNHCNVGFVLGKAKVAPAHGHTVPRLELCAAVLAVQIFEIINRELDLDIDDVRFFTDSKVVLGYIHNTSKRFFKYVENRVERIRKSTNPNQWLYVPTNQNPADVATRPTLAKTLHNSKWIYGSPQLYEEINEICESHYPIIDAESDKEVKHDVSANAMKCETNTSDNTKNFLKFSHRIERFSVWKRLIQTIDLLRSIAQKYGKTCASVPMSEPKLTSEELFIRTIQHEFFATEIECIINRKPLSRQSSILDLRPFLDSKGILRIGGRICRSDIEFQEKHPIIIPKKCHLAVLLVRHFHDSVKHQGRHYTAGALRSGGYWIVGEKRLIASILHKCVHCRKLRGKHVTQVMSDLPEDRLKPTPPFTCVGIDTFGPWNIIARKTRGGHLNCKRWAVLFTCLYSRAVHIEVIEELSTSSFINCLRRFISIRGSVKEVRSDRGTNFIGATDSLNANVLHVEKGPIKHFLSDNKITWIFNSPHSSHMGGVWERMIGSARRILDSMLKDTYCKHLTHEVLTTLMAEICAILNARPIVAVSTDPESPNILSPNMLLTQKTKHLEQVFGPYDIKDLYKNQWRCVQHLANAFWVKWRKEYLQQLQSRRKWQKETPDLSVGDIVLMKDSSVSRNEWPMGIVTNAIKSVDNKVRKVEVKTVRDGSSSTYTRPITDIVLLIHD